MKITFLTPSLELHGGNICLLKYAEYLADQGNQITIITSDKPTSLKIDSRFIVKKFHYNKIKYLDFFTFQLIYLNRTINLIEDCDFIIPIYSPYLIHALKAKTKKRLNAKIVLFFQDCFEMLWVGPYIKFILGLPSVKKNISGAIAVSQQLAKDFQSRTNISPAVIPNGIEHDIFFDRKLPKENYILFVGRTNKPKGFPVFLEAFQIISRQFPNLEANVISPDVQNHADNKIRYIRHTSRENLAKIYNKASVYVNTSLGESFGLPPLEAMASGTAVVLTDTVGSKDYAKNGNNCLVAPTNKPDQTAEAVIKLLQDSSLREKFQQSGLQTAKQFEWPKSQQKFLEYLNKL